MKINYTSVPVDLATVEDCLQMGQFRQLNQYFLFLLDLIDSGKKIILFRYPVNGNPVFAGLIRNFDDFEKWVTPFIDRY
jgi:hypothetical protein